MAKIKILTASSAEKILPYGKIQYVVNYGESFKNERSSFQVVIKSDEDVLACKLNVESDLNFLTKVRFVRSVSVEYAYSSLLPEDKYVISKKNGSYPDYLQEDVVDKFSLLKGQNKVFFITVCANDKEKLSVGLHNFKITLLNEKDEKLGETQYTLNVLDDELPKSKLMVGDWMHFDCIAHSHGVEPFAEGYYEYCKRYMQNAYDHGINVQFVPLVTPLIDTKVGGERTTAQLVKVIVNNGNYEFDFSLLKEFIDIAKEIGFSWYELSSLFAQWGGKAAPKIMATVDGEYKQLFGWDTNTTEGEYPIFLSQFLPKLMAFLTEEGIKEKCILQIYDEPVLANMDSYEKCLSLVKPYVEGVTLFATLSDLEFYEKGLVEFPVPVTGEYMKFKDKCKNFSLYYCCGTCKNLSNRFIVHPAVRTRVIGSQIYFVKARGFLHWGYNFYNNQFSVKKLKPELINDAEAAFPAGDAFIVYPGKNGPIDSIRNEILCDGWNDMRALELAETYVGRETVDKLFAKYKFKNLDKYPKNVKKFLQFRQEINKLIKDKK